MSRALLVVVAVAVAVVLAACRPTGRRIRVLEELPAGTCPRGSLEAGESCATGARDYSAGATVSVPRGHTDQPGGNLWFRWPLFDVSLDQRRMRRGIEGQSIAGGIGTHLRPLIFWPRVWRYVDVVINAGFDLGVVKEGSAVRGRGDAYVGGALDLFAPDVGPLRYLKTGVPGLRVGVRYTAFVQGWDPDTTIEVGLIWRWGVPVDLYRHWKWQRGGD